MLQYLILVFAIPLGILLAKTTSDEKSIYKKPQYFPFILKILAILTIIFVFKNQQIALTLTFIFIMTFTWNKQ